MMNKIILQARFVEDPQLKMTQSGVVNCTFRVACSRDYVPKGGERETDFFTVVAWRGTAEFIEKNFVKGDMALFYGRMQSRNFTDREGNKRMAYEVALEEIQFCGPKRGSAADSESCRCQSAAPVAGSASDDFIQVDDEDIPF